MDEPKEAWAESIRECCNTACGWRGPESDCLDYRHPIGARLCPMCHETTEQVAKGPTEAWVIEFRTHGKKKWRLTDFGLFDGRETALAQAERMQAYRNSVEYRVRRYVPEE